MGVTREGLVQHLDGKEVRNAADGGRGANYKSLLIFIWRGRNESAATQCEVMLPKLTLKKGCRRASLTLRRCFGSHCSSFSSGFKNRAAPMLSSSGIMCC